VQADVSLFPRREPTGSFWRDHSLSLVVGGILLAQTVWVMLNGHATWVADQTAHRQPAAGWPLDFWQWLGFEYVNSLVADTYGAALLILASKWFYERGSAESKD
jgi:hypothetical protein